MKLDTWLFWLFGETVIALYISFRLKSGAKGQRRTFNRENVNFNTLLYLHHALHHRRKCPIVPFGLW